MRMLGSVFAILLAAVGCTISVPVPPPASEIDNVAILVIDNFQALPATPPNVAPSANCPYSPEDVNVVGDQGAGDDLPDGESHGKAVFTLLEQQLNAVAGLTATAPRAKSEYGLDGHPGIGELKAWTHEGKEVLLVGVDHDRTTTGDIADRVLSLADAMQASKVKFTRFVLNLSFVIAPCNVAAWLKDIGMLNIDEIIANYRALIDAHPGLRRFQAALDELVRDPRRDERILLADPGDELETLRRRAAVSLFYEQILKQNETQVRLRTFGDPLKRTFDDSLNTKERRVIPVGAAGNGVLVKDDLSPRIRRVRFAFPFAPAIWNPVVSASASDKAQSPRAAYSNSGEVLMDGNWVTGPARLQGTSFAAPRLALRQAVYLFTGGAVPCDGKIPPLGYTDSDLTGQIWNDLTLEVAAATHCRDFTRRVIRPAAASPGAS